MFVVALALLIVGVWAIGETQTITMNGSVNFEIADKSLYVKDVCMQEDNNSAPYSLKDQDRFMPGFINGNFDMNLGDFTNNYGAFALYFDIINTMDETTSETFAYTVEQPTAPSGTTVDVSILGSDGTTLEQIPQGTVKPSEISDSTLVTATIKLTIASTSSSVDLSGITITINQVVPEVYDYFTFEVNGDRKTVTLTDYDSSLSDNTDIVIPATVSQNSSGEWIEGNTYTVTAITDGSVNSGVFYDSGITSVTFPSSLTSIGMSAFSGCDRLTGELNLSGCTSLTSIGNYAFYQCSGLTSVDLSGCTSLTSIGDDAFNGCSGLKGELNLGECTSLTSIGSRAFYRCSGLTGELNLGECKSLTSIGISAFYGCSGLTGELNLGECTSLTSIGSSAFQNCSGLTSISLPSSLTSIGNYAFDGCNGLTGELDLSNCTSLTSIGDGAFESCSGLTGTVTIPASVTSIGDNPFAECGNIEGIVVEEGNGEYYIEENCLIENSTKTLITGFNNSIIPNDIKVIGGFAFFRCSRLTSMTLPESLISIENNAFGNCVGLTGKLDFSKCTSLTSIENGAFAQCINLKELNLSNCASLKTIEYQTFYNCGFISIILPSNLESIEGNAFGSCGELTSISLPSSLTSIGDSAFSWCSGLTSITLPASLTSIGRNAFSNCSRLTSVTFENTTGWVVSTSSSMTISISVVVTDPSVNADNLTGQYVAYYWKRNA